MDFLSLSGEKNTYKVDNFLSYSQDQLKKNTPHSCQQYQRDLYVSNHTTGDNERTPMSEFKMYVLENVHKQTKTGLAQMHGEIRTIINRLVNN